MKINLCVSYMKAAGCEECSMVAATHEISEVERLLPLLDGLD